MLEENMRKAVNTLKSREALPNCDSRREDVGAQGGGELSYIMKHFISKQWKATN